MVTASGKKMQMCKATNLPDRFCYLKIGVSAIKFEPVQYPAGL